MEYFEGEVIYYNRYPWLSNKKYERFSYKNGNYLREDITLKKRKPGKYTGLYIYESDQFYCIDSEDGEIIPIIDYSDKANFLFRESLEGHLVKTLSFKNLGKEIIQGIECEVLEIKTQDRLEGDYELAENYYRQWVAPNLVFNPNLPHKGREFYYFADVAHYPLNCLVLKFQKLSLSGKVSYETQAIEVNWKSVEDDKLRFEYYKNQGFEVWDIDWQDERIPNGRLLDINLDLDLPIDYKEKQRKEQEQAQKEKHLAEAKKMNNRMCLALETTLNRPLTQAEKDDPQKAFLELLKTLSPKEQMVLNQQLLMHM